MIDTEKFILEIESRPPLYDPKLKDYSNKLVKANCWIEVAKVMHENWDEMNNDDQDKAGKELMKRWKTLRDAFVREFRCMKKMETGVPATKKKKYVFYEQLSFLLPHVKGNENTSSNIPPRDNLQDDDVEQDQAVDEPEVNQNRKDTNDVDPSTAERKIRQDRVVGKTSLAKTLSFASKNITNLMKESIALQKADIHLDKNNDKSGNKAFLMSFVPLMDSLPPFEAFEIRMKITEVFRDAARTRQFSVDPNLQDYSPSSTPMSSMQNSYNMQMRNSSSSSTPCSSKRKTPTPTTSMNSEEYTGDNDEFNESSSDLFNISDYVKFGIMPGQEHYK